MIQTMSGPNDWLQFYDQNLTTTQTLTPSIPDFINVVPAATTAVTTVTTPTLGTSNSSPSSSVHLSPEGRVSKPTRRRSRASRRTPTTLLNTDTTNFRAMVQQFTGGPTAPFAPTPSTAPHVLPNLMGFGFPSRSVPSLNQTTLMMSSPLGYHQQQQQQHMFQPQNQQYNNNNNNMYSSGGGAQGGENRFFQRLSNNPIRPPTSNVVGADRDGALDMDHGRFFPSASSS
ncbi:hypothetical protein VNO77_44843 [Canavalia gladiata]|uniref:VQ domain-containing protein n=1 Tax=Canavalia gladiata TaxID=3824 RepID=A0AAN9JYY4_CANGL